MLENGDLIFVKDRSGARGTVELIFQKEYNKFSSIFNLTRLTSITCIFNDKQRRFLEMESCSFRICQFSRFRSNDIHIYHLNKRYEKKEADDSAP